MATEMTKTGITRQIVGMLAMMSTKDLYETWDAVPSYTARAETDSERWILSIQRPLIEGELMRRDELIPGQTYEPLTVAEKAADRRYHYSDGDYFMELASDGSL